MAWTLDARIPLRFGPASARQPGDALLYESVGAIPDAASFQIPQDGHRPGCACCLPRSGAALALAQLFEQRARGTVPFFRRVLAVTHTRSGEQCVRDALASDPIVSGRYRADAAVNAPAHRPCSASAATAGTAE